jgi:hypothetical protein
LDISERGANIDQKLHKNGEGEGFANAKAKFFKENQ